ncbi:hypothetical protein [Pseudoalteromonas spongiae]|uniref:hypothetical protein n=1 Tax=Pseudoalteromonas spongiae TaxID=298657 RepID=UPI000C2D33B3|nr:hypothetical protein [Pseudoalteromonas spongiae]
MKLDWTLSLAKIGISTIKGDAISVAIETLSLFKSNQDSKVIDERFKLFEDPISSIHPDVLLVSEVLYIAMVENNSTTIQLTERVFDKYRRSLQMLEARGHIKFTHVAGSRYPLYIHICSPIYTLYTASISEKNKELDEISKLIDTQAVGTWLDGSKIGSDINCPVFLVNSFFELWQEQGIGFKSKTRGSCNFLVN